MVYVVGVGCHRATERSYMQQHRLKSRLVTPKNLRDSMLQFQTPHPKFLFPFTLPPRISKSLKPCSAIITHMFPL